MHDVHGGLVCMLCVGFVCMMCVGLVCLMCAHQMCVVRSKLLCVCKHGVIILFLRMHCVSACMLGECVCVCAGLQSWFSLRCMCSVCDCMWIIWCLLCLLFVCRRFVCMMCVGAYMHDVCGGFVCMMCVGACIHDVCA